MELALAPGTAGWQSGVGAGAGAEAKMGVRIIVFALLVFASMVPYDVCMYVFVQDIFFFLSIYLLPPRDRDTDRIV